MRNLGAFGVGNELVNITQTGVRTSRTHTLTPIFGR